MKKKQKNLTQRTVFIVPHNLIIRVGAYQALVFFNWNLLIICFLLHCYIIFALCSSFNTILLNESSPFKLLIKFLVRIMLSAFEMPPWQQSLIFFFSCMLYVTKIYYVYICLITRESHTHRILYFSDVCNRETRKGEKVQAIILAMLPNTKDSISSIIAIKNVQSSQITLPEMSGLESKWTIAYFIETKIKHSHFG